MNADMRAWAMLAVVLSSSGCSAVSLRPVPSDPSQRTAKQVKACRGVWEYPAVDTVSTLAGATWLGFGLQPVGSRGGPKSEDAATALQIFGISTMVLFSASATYGYYVLAQCSRLEREVADREATSQRGVATQRTPQRGAFPENVMQFRLGMMGAEAAQACADTRGAWTMTGPASALCRPLTPSLAQPAAQLDLSFGRLSAVTLMYEATDGELAELARKVLSQCIGYYGTPQVGPATWQADKPRIASWHWPNGSIELSASSRDAKSWVELRYASASEH
jgi:hypothetical protein